MTTKNDSPRTRNDFLDRMAGLNDPSMGDERERDIVLRAYTVAAVAGVYLLGGLGLVFALIGAGLWSALIIGSSGLIGVVAAVYARREGVNLGAAVERADRRRFIACSVAGAVMAMAWLAALVFHALAGHPVFSVGLGGAPIAADNSSALGALCGGVVGGGAVIAVMAITRKYRRARDERERLQALNAPDED